MSELTEIIDGQIEKFDALREVFFPEGARCFLLNSDGFGTDYVQIFEFISGWNLKYSEFRGFFRLYYATHDQGFKEKLIGSSHIAVGADVYQIQEADNVPPQGSKPYWKIACNYIGGNPYVPTN